MGSPASLYDCYQKHIKILDDRICESNQNIQEYTKTIKDLCWLYTRGEYESCQLFNLFSNNESKQVEDKQLEDEVFQEKKITNIDWMGLVENSVVIYIKVNEEIKDIEVSCEATFIINNCLNSVIIQLNLVFISTSIDVTIHFVSGQKAQFSNLKLDLEKLGSSEVNLDVLKMLSRSVDFDLNDSFKTYIPQLLLLNKLKPKLYLLVVESNMLRVYYLKKDYLQIFYNLLKEICDCEEYSNILKSQKVKGSLKESLVQELLYCNQIIKNNEDYQKMRRKLLDLEINTDLILGVDEYCFPLNNV